MEWEVIFMRRRIIVLGMALVMLFSFVMFGASSCEVYDPRLTEMQRRIEELEEAARLQTERVALHEHRASAVLKLEEHAADRGQDNFTIENWSVIQSYVVDGVLAINAALDKNEVDAALEEAKENIDLVEDNFCEEMAYILSHFDLSDPKVVWDEYYWNPNPPSSSVVRYRIIFRRLNEGMPFPQIEPRHFGLNLLGVNNPIEWIDWSEDRDSAFLWLSHMFTFPIMAPYIVRQLETLEFIREVRPQAGSMGGW